MKNAFIDYGEYLRSLVMNSEIKPFDSVHFDRIIQLISKTNQFNLTNKQYSFSELEKTAADKNYITLCATLEDKFGSNGIVSTLIGEIIDRDLHIRLWVMSFRVYKRDLELAMLDRLAYEAQSTGIEKLIGYYYPTAKNVIVSGLYETLGFCKAYEGKDGETVWEYMVNSHINRNKVIDII